MEITGALEDAKEVVTKLTGAMDENNKIIEQVEISKQTAFLVINQAFEILQQTLEERKKTLLSELEAISLSKTTALTLQKEQFEKMIGDVGHYTDMASQILQTHTDHEIVALGGLIPTELQATLKRVQTISLTPNQHSNITVSVQIDDLIENLSKLGNLFVFYPSPSSSTWTSTSVARVESRYYVKVQSKTSKGEEYPHGGVEMKGEMRSKTHNGAVVYGEVEDHRDGTYTITLTPQTAGPHQLLITMDGQHVQNSPNDLDVRPKRDYRILCNAQQVIQCHRPLCVAIHDNGDIYVGSDDGCIYVFDQTGQLKNTIGRKGRGDGQFLYPSGISIKGDVLYVADTNNHRVQKLTSSGKFLHKFGQQGSGQGQFNLPVSVIIDSNNKLIVCDCDDHRVQIFNENGGWLLTIDGKGSGNHSFESPCGLALDPQGNIHVAAYDTNTIKVFTNKGVYVRMYGDLNRPSGIAIDDEGYSLVSECWGNCLSIYDPEGNKIHTVGNLKYPYECDMLLLWTDKECKVFDHGTILSVKMYDGLKNKVEIRGKQPGALISYMRSNHVTLKLDLDDYRLPPPHDLHIRKLRSIQDLWTLEKRRLTEGMDVNYLWNQVVAVKSVSLYGLDFVHFYDIQPPKCKANFNHSIGGKDICFQRLWKDLENFSQRRDMLQPIHVWLFSTPSGGMKDVPPEFMLTDTQPRLYIVQMALKLVVDFGYLPSFLSYGPLIDVLQSKENVEIMKHLTSQASDRGECTV
eukprot:Em0004g365a